MLRSASSMNLAISPRTLELLRSKDVERAILQQLTPGNIVPTIPIEHWKPGRRLALLLVGAVGIGNVGADMRSGEIVRQLRWLLGDKVSLDVLATGQHWPIELMRGVGRRELGLDFAQTIAMDVARHHGMVACEGSMFKSTFSNVLSALMGGALGAAAAAGKLSVGYGAEIGAMEPILESFVTSHLNGALILCRNRESREHAKRLSLRAAEGADTAWTFEAAAPQRAAVLLREAGWNGSDPLLIVCPNNPFWWPVRPEPRLAQQMRKCKDLADLFYGFGFMFHTCTPERERKYQAYLGQLGMAIRHLAHSRKLFPVLVAMDRADTLACRDLAVHLGGAVPTLLGHSRPAAEIVAVLRLGSLLVSSRFHALVGAMPAAVPSIGIAMDERISNLLRDDRARVLTAEDPELGSALIRAAARLDPRHIRASSRATVATGIGGMGRMAKAFVEEAQRLLPDFPFPSLGRGGRPYLPPLPRIVDELLS